MGRYAFFNTEFEYKFIFAVQPSEDILKFGGIPDLEDKHSPKHTWTTKDKDLILGRLKDLEESLNLPTHDFERYEKSVKGTWKLREFLYTIEINACFIFKGASEEYSKLFATYILGCILYHQLLYTEVLTASYEL